MTEHDYEMAQLETLLGHDQTIALLVKDIIAHYESCRKDLLTGKAMVAVIALHAVAAEVSPRAVLDLPPGPGNSRNSEGSLVELKDGRVLFAYSKFIGGTGADGDQCVIAARTSLDKAGEKWETVKQTIEDAVRGVS